MKIIDWNISYAGNPTNKFEYLKSKFDKATIAILQEVTPEQFKALNSCFRDIANIKYSLKYRKPGKYDTKQRQLGVAILATKDIEIVKTKCLDRCLLPDRTLMVDIKYKNKILRVMGLHSITGCDHKKAKSIQFLSFAEAIDEYKPDIVTFDANEPDIDHYDINNMTFFTGNKDNGKAARTFFETLINNNLHDSLTEKYDSSKYKEGEPLAISHIINGKLKKRYDFVFTNKKIKECSYYYNESIKAGSDHALIEVMV